MNRVKAIVAQVSDVALGPLVFVLLALKSLFLSDIFFLRDKISVLVIFDDEEQLKILKECHDDNGHKGVTSVINTIGARYFWPKWTNQVKEYVL